MNEIETQLMLFKHNFYVFLFDQDKLLKKLKNYKKIQL